MSFVEHHAAIEAAMASRSLGARAAGLRDIRERVRRDPKLSAHDRFALSRRIDYCARDVEAELAAVEAEHRDD